jgi:hypothetical protein
LGYDYTYHLYIYREHVWTTLRALGQHAPPGKTEHTVVHLPGGEVLAFPIFPGLKADPVFYTEQTSFLELDASLWLQVDRDEWEMFREDGWSLDEQGRVSFGSLDLTVDFRREKPGPFVAFRFTGVTDGMSNLMEHSRSLQRVFSRLLAENGGICGILDREDYQDAILLWREGQETSQNIPFPEPTNCATSLSAV